MTADGEFDLRAQLARRIRARRDELGLSQQGLADRAGVHVNTIINMEQGKFAERRNSAWAKIEKALDWPPRFFDDYLSGAVTDDLEARYRRGESVIDAGRLVEVVEDAVYAAFMAGAPNSPLESYDKALRAAFEVLREAGINPIPRNDDASSRNDSGV